MKALTLVWPRLYATLLCSSSVVCSAHAQSAPATTPSSLPAQTSPAQAQPSQTQGSSATPSLQQPSPGTQQTPSQAPSSFVAATAQGAPQPAPVEGAWTMLAAENHALERAPRVRSAEAARNTAQAYRTFGTMPRAANPTVNLRAMIGKPDDPAATYGVLFGVPFDVAGRRRAWRREAGFISEQAEAELAAVRNEVRSEARNAFVTVAMAAAAKLVAEQSADTARELSERVQARLAANATTALDVALAQSQHAEATANLARAQRTLIEAQAMFRQALGLPHGEPVDVMPVEQPSIPRGLTVEAAVERARMRRREPAAWGFAKDRWHAADKRLRREAVGPMTAAFETETQGNYNRQNTVGGSLNFELPFVYRNQGERAVAEKQADAAELEGELARSLIEREASSSYRRLEAALSELAAIEEGALPAAERTLIMVHTMLDAGVVDYFRLLTARSVAFALRSRRVETLREAWLSRIALERAIGGWEETP
jgi:outer membrane protein TolC